MSELARVAPGTEHRMLVSVHSAGGTPYSGIKKGTAFYQRGMSQVAGARTRARLDGRSYVVRAVTAIHGESDSAEGSTSYEADMVEWQSDYETDVRRLTGQTQPVPMFHSQNSAQAQSRIPLDMLNAHVRNPGKIVLVGPKYHLPLADGTHLTTDGYRHCGEDYAKVYKRVIIDGETWEPLRPKTIERVGAKVTLTFYVPAPPLVLDTQRVAEAPGLGFRYVDGEADTPTVIGVEVTAPDTVVVTLSATPVGPGTIRYAYWDQLGFDGPRGNLRDSDPTRSRFGYDLFNWGVQFEADVP